MNTRRVRIVPHPSAGSPVRKLDIPAEWEASCENANCMEVLRVGSAKRRQCNDEVHQDPGGAYSAMLERWEVYCLKIDFAPCLRQSMLRRSLRDLSSNERNTGSGTWRRGRGQCGSACVEDNATYVSSRSLIAPCQWSGTPTARKQGKAWWEGVLLERVVQVVKHRPNTELQKTVSVGVGQGTEAENGKVIHTRQGDTDTAVASKGWQGDKKYEEPKRAGVSKKKKNKGEGQVQVRFENGESYDELSYRTWCQNSESDSPIRDMCIRVVACHELAVDPDGPLSAQARLTGSSQAQADAEWEGRFVENVTVYSIRQTDIGRRSGLTRLSRFRLVKDLTLNLASGLAQALQEPFTVGMVLASPSLPSAQANCTPPNLPDIYCCVTRTHTCVRSAMSAQARHPESNRLIPVVRKSLCASRSNQEIDKGRDFGEKDMGCIEMGTEAAFFYVRDREPYLRSYCVASSSDGATKTALPINLPKPPNNPHPIVHTIPIDPYFSRPQ
ncbi:hypothetical protein BGY98DRAFT_937657 [Russula aff. rugulosa BPL654]|nr:hypothetical protein BGY98DRAFT_937657 [Russula aff. rugulosa BPL654]